MSTQFKPRSRDLNGRLWGARVGDWASIQEGTVSPVYAAVLERTHVKPGTRYLDVGCGAGMAAQMAAAGACIRHDGNGLSPNQWTYSPPMPGSTWADTPLGLAFAETGRTSLRICGYWLDDCITFTALNALGEGCDLFLLTDAAARRSRAATWRSCACSRLGIVPTSTRQALHEWSAEIADGHQRGELLALISAATSHVHHKHRSLLWRLTKGRSLNACVPVGGVAFQPQLYKTEHSKLARRNARRAASKGLSVQIAEKPEQNCPSSGLSCTTVYQ
jgi:hypothetical protein